MSSVPSDVERHHPIALVGLVFSGVLLGGVLGAVANSINGWVSPLYFRIILGWHDVENIWRATVAQGIFEGFLFGLFFALVFTVVIGVVSRARCTYREGIVYLLSVAAAALVFWAIGGLLGMGLATLSPEFYQHAFRGVPKDPDEMLRYAWVGGSIWGLEFGGLVLTILGLVVFHAKWRTR